MLRAKFRCDSRTEYMNNASVLLVPVVDGSLENKDFFEATPGGELRMDIVSLDAAKQLKPGKEYYIDLTEA